MTTSPDQTVSPMMEEADKVGLKACPNPWCKDSRPTWVLRGHNLVIECMNCGMTGPHGDTEAEALAAWNARVPDPAVSGLRHDLCMLIESQAPRRDPFTHIPIGTEVEALADAILATFRKRDGSAMISATEEPAS